MKKIAIAATMSHSGFCSGEDASAFADGRATAETGAGEVCGRRLVDGASAESRPVDGEFITDLQ